MASFQAHLIMLLNFRAPLRSGEILGRVTVRFLMICSDPWIGLVGLKAYRYKMHINLANEC
jgi:hypothetical protein